MVAVAAGLASAAVAVAPHRALAAPAPMAAARGTVSTLAGPDFCPGRSVVDREASTVRALSVDRSGRIHVDTGRTSEGVLGTVDPEGNAALLPTGIAGPPKPPRSRVDASPPARLAPDGSGGVLMAVGARIVQMHGRGGATVVAGGEPARASAGGAGDGGPLSAARFTAVASVATDGDGNLFVAERVGGTGVRIRLANRSPEPVTVYPGTPHQRTIGPGAIDTIAGLASPGQGGGRRPALTARFEGTPPAMAVAGPRLYLAAAVASPGGPRTGVQLINLGGETMVAHGVSVEPGAVETVAGGGPSGFGGDRGPARSASFSSVSGITTDDDGALYLADTGNHRVRRVDGAGVVTTFAGTGGTGANAGGFDGNDRAAVEARLNRPYDVKAGPDGRIYVADQLNHQLRFVDRAGIIHAARGNGIGLSWSCPQRPATPVQGLSPRPTGTDPGTLAASGAGVYFAAPSSGAVMRIDATGAVSPVVPGNGAQYRQPRAVARRGAGPLYVLDGNLLAANVGDRLLRLHGTSIAPGAVGNVLPGAGDEISTVALSAVLPPGAVAAGVGGDVFIADGDDYFAQRVRRLDANGGVSAVGGPGTPLAAAGCCGQPAGLAVDARGNLYVASAVPPRVWFVNRSTRPARAQGQAIPAGEARVVAGTGTPGFGGDGAPAVDAQLRSPRGVAVDREGVLYVSDAGEHTVRRIDATGVISTVVGTGTAAFNGDGLKAAITALSSPGALAIDSCGNLLVADAGNQRVRRVNLSGACSAAPAPAEGGRSPVPLLGGMVVLGIFAGALGGVLIARRGRQVRR